MEIKFWGTRGSIPVPGKNTIKYGGNTPCVEVKTTNGKTIILDAGSGIRELGNYLVKNNSAQILIFISHYHWDHIQGIPFFAPLYDKNKSIIFYGLHSLGTGIEKLLKNQMNPNHFPVNFSQFNADISFKDISVNEVFNIDEIKIETLMVNHPAPALTYKITEDSKTLIYMTDNEIKLNENNPDDLEQIEKLNHDSINFCSEADYLIHDAMYDESLIKGKKGWGHSSNISLAYFSILAKVKNLILFHYNPDFTDEKIDNLLEETKGFIKGKNSRINCLASKEGLQIII